MYNEHGIRTMPGTA